MTDCKRCGAGNGGGRETCWRCGADLVDIKGVIETDRKVGIGLKWAVAGGLVGVVVFLTVFFAVGIGRMNPDTLISLALGVAWAGFVLGGLIAFMIGILTRR